MKKGIEIENQFLNALSRFEERVKHTGLILWHRTFKRKFEQIKAEQKAKEDTIAKKLTQAETEAKALPQSEAAKKLLQRIYEIKGLLVLTLVFLNIFQVSVPALRPMTRANGNGLRSGMRFERVIRKREGET